MKLRVDARNGVYDICIGKGLLGKVPLPENGRYAVVTDENVHRLYGGVFDAGRCIILPPGENTKNLAELNRILDRLLEMGLDRSDTLFALGGGVVGDIAGFAAAIYKRGMQFVQLPTTLLAQVDSAVGGKVAVNLAHGKNMAGTFYQPKAVFADVAALETLDERQYAAGMAEVIKYAYIADRALYLKLKERTYTPEEIVYDCCSIKAGIVRQDPYDTGERMKLNFGHTIGHALETVCGYGNMLHGEAVAAGMVYAGLLGERLGVSPQGLADDIADMAGRYGLPAAVPHNVLEDALDVIRHDKKAQGDTIRFILIDKVGHAVIEKIGVSAMKKLLGGAR